MRPNESNARPAGSTGREGSSLRRSIPPAGRNTNGSVSGGAVATAAHTANTREAAITPFTPLKLEAPLHSDTKRSRIAVHREGLHFPGVRRRRGAEARGMDGGQESIHDRHPQCGIRTQRGPLRVLALAAVT